MPQAAAQLSQVLKLEQQSVFVNCWHELEHESDAVWRQYAQKEDGIAIVTTFGSLVESLGSFPEHEARSIRIGRVQYVDYDTELVPEFDGMPYFHKRKPFSHEQELRFAKSAILIMATVNHFMLSQLSKLARLEAEMSRNIDFYALLALEMAGITFVAFDQQP